ncbi:phage tail protein [Archangium gephyra]|uniref:phage tail protein n=1 Tax=Archangium gephyra TaxID=48 RepID=UPI0035D49D00
MIGDHDELPVGTLVPFAGPITLATRDDLSRRGWLPCDGAEVTQSLYPELFRVIGRAYGWPNDSSKPGVFYLPDCRGLFLRGVNGDATRWADADPPPPRDPDAKDRTAYKNGNAGNQVGSVQLDGFQEHEHVYAHVVQAGTVNNTQGTMAVATINDEDKTTSSVSTSGGARAVPQETRPINLYVNFIIKCRHHRARHQAPGCHMDDEPLFPDDEPLFPGSRR